MHEFLMEIIRKIDTPTVVFKLSDSVTAAVVRSQSNGEEGHEYFCY